MKIVTLLFISSFAFASESEPYKTLADTYAPAILHEIGKNAKADVPTNYDFDGDYFADNNWANLEKFDVDPFVYYDVRETQTHFFITYAFFHPRDYTKMWCLPKLCHENDLEGVLFTVRKDNGSIVLVETLAHLKIAQNFSPTFYSGTSEVKAADVQRVALRIQAGGHGVYVWEGKVPKKFEFYLPTDDNSLPDIKNPIQYRLKPIRELWALNRSSNIDRIFKGKFNFKNERFEVQNLLRTFAGKKYGTASLPWGWGSLGETRGEWFLDPAFWVFKKLGRPNDFSLDYVSNPYLEK